eukprot:2935034-Ditylum_brightwellii.AAC.1
MQFVDSTKLAHNDVKTDLQPVAFMSITSHSITQCDTYLNIDGCLLELFKTVDTVLLWQFNEYGMPIITPKAELPQNTVQVRLNSMLGIDSALD